MRIAHRIALGFALVLSTTAAGALVSWLAVERLQSAFALTERTQTMRVDLSSARNAEAAYRRTGDPGDAAAVARSVERLEATADRLASDWPDGAGLLSALAESAAGYRAAFERYADATALKQDKVAAMAERVDTIMGMAREVERSARERASTVLSAAAAADARRRENFALSETAERIARLGALARAAEGRLVEDDTEATRAALERSLRALFGETLSLRKAADATPEAERVEDLFGTINAHRQGVKTLRAAIAEREAAAADHAEAVETLETALEGLAAAGSPSTPRLARLVRADAATRTADAPTQAGPPVLALVMAAERYVRRGWPADRMAAERALADLREGQGTDPADPDGHAAPGAPGDALAAVEDALSAVAAATAGVRAGEAALAAARQEIERTAGRIDVLTGEVARRFAERYRAAAERTARLRGEADAARAVANAGVHLALAAAELSARVGAFLRTEDLAADANAARIAISNLRGATLALVEAADGDVSMDGESVELDGLVAAYAGDFEAVVEAIRAEAAATASMNAAAAGVSDAVARATIAQNEARTAESRLILLLLFGGAGAALLLGCAVAVVLGRRISRPIVSITETMNRLARRDFAVEIAGEDRSDEVGDMARAVVVFRENGLERERLEASQAAERAARERRLAEVDAAVAGFRERMGALTERLADASGRMRANANALTETADHTTADAGRVAAAAEETSVNMQAVAGATEEMNRSIEAVSEQVESARTVAGTASDQATRTAQTVDGLAGTAERIGEVIELINTIAEQTNLLALNATIEAARAGSAGKGFAVVATEVKHLAGRTGKATEEIKAQISAVQTETRSAVEAIGSITTTIADIGAMAASIVDAVEEQSRATREIAGNVAEAAGGASEVARTIEGVRAGTDRTSDAARGVLEIADALAVEAEELKAGVESFLERIDTGREASEPAADAAASAGSGRTTGSDGLAAAA